MSDSYFDAGRASGEYPRKDYNRQTEDEKRAEIVRKLHTGWRLAWVLREAARLGIAVPGDPGYDEFLNPYAAYLLLLAQPGCPP